MSAGKHQTLPFLVKTQELDITPIEFVSIGMACHALCLIDYAGILKKLQTMEVFLEKDIFTFSNFHLVKAALVTLVGAKILRLKDKAYTLSTLGKQLAENIGLITVPLNGYRKLFAKQFQLLTASSTKSRDIDFGALAAASMDFGVHEIESLLISVFKTIRPKGTICDLGCGTGEKLIKVCEAFNVPGLGIEQSSQAIKRGKKYIKSYPKVEIIRGDITALDDVWEDVEIVMMSFVCHDISSPQMCSQMLRALQHHFPHMRYLVLVDIVAFSEQMPTIMPGFDYVHGLQGITPRNYKETHDVLKSGHYDVVQELPVPNMPNTFIWTLQPRRPKL